MECKKCGKNFEWIPGKHFKVCCDECLIGWTLKMPIKSELDNKVFKTSEDALQSADDILKREKWYEDDESLYEAIGLGYVGAYCVY